MSEKGSHCVFLDRGYETVNRGVIRSRRADWLLINRPSKIQIKCLKWGHKYTWMEGTEWNKERENEGGISCSTED